MSKELLEHLRSKGLTSYGSFIPADVVRGFLGLEIPKYGTKKEFDQIALAELGAVDYCRNVLLGEGKYLGQVHGNYRIFLPSENARQIDQYINQADSKLRRAMKLSRNTPVFADKQPDNTDARIAIKRDAIAAQKASSELLM